MAETSKIEWTDATWNPITGCSVVSPGCTNCYAMRLAGTRLKHHWSRKGLTDQYRGGPVWNGEVRFNEKWLDQPMRWRKPRMIFVCAHGDLFHEDVPDWWIIQVFAVMETCRRHTFQVLTKRPARARTFMRLASQAVRTMCINGVGRGYRSGLTWPLPNVWIGTSVEDQARAEERIPVLLRTPAAVRFVSYEPALGPVDLDQWENIPGLNRGDDIKWLDLIDWVICGGESGPHARDMDPDWARSIRDQCAGGGVPFFMKQMAHKAPIPDDLLVREYPA